MSGLRGYYQGIGRMLPSAVSQLSEQSVRVAAMLAMLAIGWHLGWADDSLAAGATAGSAFGAAAGLAVITAYWLRDRGHGGRGGVTNLSAGDTGDPARVGEGSGVRQVWVLEGKTLVEMPAGAAEAYRDGGGDFGRQASREAVAGEALRSGHLVDVHAGGQLRGGLLQVVRRLAALAVPVTLGALAVPALSVVDAFTVPRLLRETGADGAGAMALFGLYSRGQPLVQLVVMVASAVAAALVPALAAARVRGNLAETKQHAAFVMRAAWAIGAAAAAGLALLAEPVNVMLYADNAGTLTFALVACTALAGTVNAVAAAVLQGLGSVRAPALFMLAAASLKAVLNAALVPAFGIAGAAWAGIAALVAAALLSAGAVRRATGAAMPARSAAGIGLALAVMAAALVLAEHGGAALLGPLPPRAAAAALALGGTALGGALFAAALLRCGGISERELRGLPGGAAIAERLHRWRLLPRSD
jgi:O-antigen/teichoic acid export membrane protein